MIFNKKRTGLLFLIISLLTVLTGCWDNRNFKDLGLVAAIGIDKVEDGGYLVTYQLINPAVMKSKKGGERNNKEAFWVYSNKGETIFQAIRDALTVVNKKIYFNYLQLMVIGEDMAKEGIADILDFFERDPEVRKRVYVLVTKGISAKKVLEAKSELEDIPAMHLTDIIENTAFVAKVRNIALIDLFRQLNYRKHDVVTGAIEYSKDKIQKDIKISDLKVEGGAVFSKDNLTAYLDAEEMRGFLFVENKINNIIVNINNPIAENKQIAIEIKRSTTKIDVIFKDNIPVLSVNIKAEGNIGEQQGQMDLSRDSVIKKIEQEMENKIKLRVTQTIIKAQQEYNSDIFGFSGVISRENNKKWEEYKNNWHQIFSRSPFKIKVGFKIRGTGIIRKPHQVS